MRLIERHPIDLEFAAKVVPGQVRSLRRNLDKLTEPNVATLSFSLGTLLDTAQMCLGNQCVLDPVADKAETWVSMTHFTQISYAMFATATTDRDVVDCLIDGRCLRLPATGPTRKADAWTWEKAAYLAAACRSHDRLRELMSVSENILRAESAAYDDFLYAWVAALQAYFTGELSEVEGKLLETVRLLAPESVSDRSHPDRLNEIVRPQLLLFLALLSSDSGRALPPNRIRQRHSRARHGTATERRLTPRRIADNNRVPPVRAPCEVH